MMVPLNVETVLTFPQGNNVSKFKPGTIFRLTKINRVKDSSNLANLCIAIGAKIIYSLN